MEMSARISPHRSLESTEFDSDLGTIGGGNHFAELQAVEKVHDTGRSSASGFGKQQLVVLVHSGSRGLGESILRAYVEEHQASGSDARVLCRPRHISMATTWPCAGPRRIVALIARRLRHKLGAEAESALGRLPQQHHPSRGRR